MVPTSLLTAMIDTTPTRSARPVRASSSVSAGRRVDAGQLVDVDDGAPVTLDHVQHGVVLGGRADGAPGAAAQRAGDGGVVTLGAATREHHLARPAPDRGGDLVAGVVDGPAGVAGQGVRPRGVGEAGREERQHRLDRLRPHRRGGRVVEVHRVRRPPPQATAAPSGAIRPPTPPRWGTLARWRQRHAGLPPDVVRRRLRRRVRRLVRRAPTTRPRRWRFLDDVATVAAPGGPARVLELAVGTGRLAVPLSARPRR